MNETNTEVTPTNNKPIGYYQEIIERVCGNVADDMYNQIKLVVRKDNPVPPYMDVSFRVTF